MEYTKNMLLITSTWKEGKTFKMIPISDFCPYVECIFDPQLKILAVIGKNKKETFHMLPRIDANGDPEMRKNYSPKDGSKPYKEERRSLETYQEYYIEEEKEIINFVEKFGNNIESFDFMSYILSNPAEVISNSVAVES
jgi:hypothetical protein